MYKRARPHRSRFSSRTISQPPLGRSSQVRLAKWGARSPSIRASYLLRGRTCSRSLSSPPGRSTRASSRKTPRGFRTVHRTKLPITYSKEASGNGRAWRSAQTNSTFAPSRAALLSARASIPAAPPPPPPRPPGDGRRARPRSPLQFPGPSPGRRPTAFFATALPP